MSDEKPEVGDDLWVDYDTHGVITSMLDIDGDETDDADDAYQIVFRLDNGKFGWVYISDLRYKSEMKH